MRVTCLTLTGPEDGSVYYGSLRNAHATDVYTMKGPGASVSGASVSGASVPGAEVFEPKFTAHGFRYLELSGLDYTPQPQHVVRLVIHNDVSSRSALAFNMDGGADVLNKVAQGCRNTIVGNLVGGPQSCSSRDERAFFTGDTALAAEASLQHFDVAAIYTHWVRTVQDTQRVDGAIGDYAPDTVGDHRDGHSNWGTAFPTAPWMVCRCDGWCMGFWGADACVSVCVCV